jgi:hypothetical protein
VEVEIIFGNGNSASKFSNGAEAGGAALEFNETMYCTDSVTGETLFQFHPHRAARSVILEAVANQRRLRVRMRRCADDWIARLKLPSGWCIYRFEVDGRSEWDRSAGKMKTRDGQPCSLAMITGGTRPVAA